MLQQTWPDGSLQVFLQTLIFPPTTPSQLPPFWLSQVSCVIWLTVVQSIARRSTLGLLAGAAALLTKTGASQAAFGDAANVFGKYVPYIVVFGSQCLTGGPGSRVVLYVQGHQHHRIHPLRRRGLCPAAAFKVEPFSGAGVPRHSPQVRPAAHEQCSSLLLG